MNRHGEYVREKSYIRIIGIFSLVFCGVLLFYYLYYHHCKETIFEESSAYLVDLSKGISDFINEKIDSYYDFLHMMSNFLAVQKVDNMQEVKNLIFKQDEELRYQDLLFIDDASVGHRLNGKAISLSDDKYIQKTITSKKQSLSTLQTIDYKKTVLLSIPVYNLYLDEKNIVALALSIEAEEFERVLSLPLFNERASSFLVNEEGKLMIGSSTHNEVSIGYDTFQKFYQSQKDAVTIFTNDVEQSNTKEIGQVNFSVDGQHISMTYKQTDYEDLYLLTFLSGTMAYKKSNMLLKTTLMIFGGILVISLALAFFLALFHRKYRIKLESIAYVDPVTGGNTLQAFYKSVAETITASKKKQYALIYTNIRNFKMLNEQLGYNNCNSILQCIYESIRANMKGKEVVGRVMSDHFCVLLEYKNNENLRNRFFSWYMLAKQKIEQKQRSHWTQPEIEFGVFIIEEPLVSIPQMLDRAKLALCDTKVITNSRLRYAIYDDQLRQKLLREQHIEVIMEDALQQGEFQVYLQPKYSTTDEQLIGAEALTRWISKTEGIIYPSEFIPIFEKNGFIVKLDFWIFEEVCRLLRNWLDNGSEPIKISVNCSRILFKEADFVAKYVAIAQSYNIPPYLIEIEMTENLVLENMDRFIKVIEEIQKAGFGCSVDDFGSGYSSLSLIKDIAVDTLKLDKVFFRYSEQEKERAKFVISSILSMAKSLSMKTVAEGVENREQVEMLKQLGCDYIQGYVFAKPMPVTEFNQVFNRN